MCILVLNSIPLQSTLRSSYQRGILLRHLLLSLFAETGVYKRRTKANSFSFFFRIIFQKNCLSSVVPRSSCKPYLNSRCWPGTSLQLRLMRGVFSNANGIYLFWMIFPLHEPPLQASSSPIPGIHVRIWSIWTRMIWLCVFK